MGNDFQEDDLQVEQYNAETVEMKRKKILKKVGIGIGVAITVGVLGYFGLTSIQEGSSSNTTSPNRSSSNTTSPNTTSPNTIWHGPQVVGGSGSWYASVVVHLEGSHG